MIPSRASLAICMLCFLLVGCNFLRTLFGRPVLRDPLAIPMDTLVSITPPPRMGRGEVHLFYQDSAVVIDRTFTARVEKITLDSILFNDGHLLRAGLADLRSTALQVLEVMKVRWQVDNAYFSNYSSVRVTTIPGDSLRLQLVQRGANAPISERIMGFTLRQDTTVQDTVAYDKMHQLILRPRCELVSSSGAITPIPLNSPDTVDQGGRTYLITVFQNLHTRAAASNYEDEGPAYQLFHAAWEIP